MTMELFFVGLKLNISELMEDWKEFKDSDGSVKYFFNIKTGITTTERPPELGGKSAKSSYNKNYNDDQVASLLRSIDETHQSLAANNS